jgi:hypothetical protein
MLLLAHGNRLARICEWAISFRSGQDNDSYAFAHRDSSDAQRVV